MDRKYVYLILGLTFLSILLILSFFIGGKPGQAETQDVQTETPPFLSYISGSGVVEPASGNILISPPFTRTVEQVNVSVNGQVKKGEVLFQLYNQDLTSTLQSKQKNYEESLSHLHKLEALPREEDLTIAQESLNKAQALFNTAKLEYCMTRCCARSKDERCLLLYKFQQAEAEFRMTLAEFRKVQSGAWQPELQIARDAVEQAQADMEAMKGELERTYVKSPIDGTVLQIKIHEGETADPSKTAVIVGNTDALNIRVAIDQFNESRFHPGCPAVAFKQGALSNEIPLKFLHTEPYMVPKKYLSNELHEKVDTQVFEILYRIEKNDAHLYVGEQMDVYIYVDQNDKAGCSGADGQSPQSP